MVFPVVMYGCEIWIIKKSESWRIDAFELWCWRRLLRVPWTARRSNQSILKDQSWIFIGRTDAEAEAPVVWPCDAKSQFIRKDPDAWKDWMQEKATTEDEMVGWHHWLNGQEFEQALVIAYGGWRWIRDLWRRFSFGTQDQDWSLKNFCVAEFY